MRLASLISWWLLVTRFIAWYNVHEQRSALETNPSVCPLIHAGVPPQSPVLWDVTNMHEHYHSSLQGQYFSQCDMHPPFLTARSLQVAFRAIIAVARMLGASKLTRALRGPRSCESSRRGFGCLEQSESSKHKLRWTFAASG